MLRIIWARQDIWSRIMGSSIVKLPQPRPVHTPSGLDLRQLLNRAFHSDRRMSKDVAYGCFDLFLGWYNNVQIRIFEGREEGT